MGVIQKHRNLGQPSLPHSPFVPPAPLAPAMHAKHLTTFLKGNIPLAIGNEGGGEATCCLLCKMQILLSLKVFRT